MIDRQKTFDNVDHQFAYRTFQLIGISSIKRFQTCLTGRT